MSRGLSSAAKAELHAANNAEPWIVLLTISHADFAATLRFVGDMQNVTSGGDVYTALAFGATIPADRDGPVGAKLTLDNVDRATVAEFRTITTSPTVTIEVIRRGDPNTIIASWPNLRLAGATISLTRIELDLAGDVVLDESYPGWTFAPIDFPAGFDR